MNEGYHVDNAGNLIMIIYVDFRRQADRVPITALIKGCESRHAIERCMKIRLSKPEVFRKIERGLIGDPAEARQSSIRISNSLNEQSDALRVRPANSESGVATEPMKTPSRYGTNDSKTAPTTTESLTSGKNGWIFCTSIEPTSQSEKDKWLGSMNVYDHISHIRHPREFARALGSMVAEQYGPQGKNTTLNHTFDDKHHPSTEHKVQIVYHGPVVYADSPFERIFSSPTKTEVILLPIFIKESKFQDQQEYRFTIMASKEPAKDTINLDASSAMLDAMQGRRKWSTAQVMPKTLHPEKSSSTQDMLDEHDSEATSEEAYGPHLLASVRAKFSLDSAVRSFVNNPATPIIPNTYDLEKLPPDLHETVMTYAALTALRDSIGGITGTGRLTGTRYVESASSAWHADPCIRRMCAAFEDPIANISISNENAVVIRLKFPDKSRWKGHVAICPDGQGKCMIENGRNTTTRFDIRVRPLRDGIVEHLKRTDIPVRRNFREPSNPNPETIRLAGRTPLE